jgi:hypothetical protein
LIGKSIGPVSKKEPELLAYLTGKAIAAQDVLGVGDGASYDAT